MEEQYHNMRRQQGELKRWRDRKYRGRRRNCDRRSFREYTQLHNRKRCRVRDQLRGGASSGGGGVSSFEHMEEYGLYVPQANVQSWCTGWIDKTVWDGAVGVDRWRVHKERSKIASPPPPVRRVACHPGIYACDLPILRKPTTTPSVVASRSKKKNKAKWDDSAHQSRQLRWLLALTGLDDPLTLEPLEALPYSPFVLEALSQHQYIRPSCYRPSVEALVARLTQFSYGWRSKSTPLQTKLHRDAELLNRYHLFDGVALANYYWTTRKFINPLNRRPLRRWEVEALDKYLAEQQQSQHQPFASLTDVFDAAVDGIPSYISFAVPYR